MKNPLVKLYIEVKITLGKECEGLLGIEREVDWLACLVMMAWVSLEDCFCNE